MQVTLDALLVLHLVVQQLWLNDDVLVLIIDEVVEIVETDICDELHHIVIVVLEQDEPEQDEMVLLQLEALEEREDFE